MNLEVEEYPGELQKLRAFRDDILSEVELPDYFRLFLASGNAKLPGLVPGEPVLPSRLRLNRNQPRGRSERNQPTSSIRIVGKLQGG